LSRDIRLYLDDMIEAAERVLSYTAGMSFDEFVVDFRSYDAVLRNFMVLGEAARYVPEGLRNQYRDIPWTQLIGFRNVVIHEYPGLDDAIVWQIIQTDVPPLLAHVREILASLE
jgi:uncharacterized protein with HEPN domain